MGHIFLWVISLLSLEGSGTFLEGLYLGERIYIIVSEVQCLSFVLWWLYFVMPMLSGATSLKAD